MSDASPRLAATEIAPQRVTLTSLTLSNFRNYESAKTGFDASLVALTGENGAGKTNLLEAISLLTPGRGLRRASFEEIRRAGAESGWAVAATIMRNGAETRIGTGSAEAGNGEARSRAVRIDGTSAASADELLDLVRILWLTPAMDGLFTGPASERRRFLDRLVLTVDASHARRTRDLEKLLTQRNRLLEENASAAWLDAVEAELAASAVAVALARAETLALLSAAMQRRLSERAAFPAGQFLLAGEFDQMIAGRSAAEAELSYRQTLRESRPADRAAGRTLFGPHRSDLDVSFAEKGMPAALSSTGEQKALLIGLVLAHAELTAGISGMTPLLLLDEVAAHLDRFRRAALFERLAQLGCQTFVTGTDATLFANAPPDTAHYKVFSGQVERSLGVPG